MLAPESKTVGELLDSPAGSTETGTLNEGIKGLLLERTASLSPAVSKTNAGVAERRGWPRQTLHHCVVLVYFDEDNWGKLADLSEGGMAFELARRPSLRRQASFTLQAMGCMPMLREGSPARFFEATASVIWTREFERIAGAQFVDLAKESREQITKWLAFETSAGTMNEKLPPEAVPGSAAVPEKLTAPAPAVSELLSEADEKESREVDRTQSPAQPPQEAQSPLALQVRGLHAVGTRDLPSPKQQLQPGSTVGVKLPRSRMSLIAASCCLAAAVLILGATIIVTNGARRGAAFESDARPTAQPIKTASAVFGSSADSARPFQVEVEDADRKRWLLKLFRNTSKNAYDPFAPEPIAPRSSTAPAAKALEQAPPAGKPQRSDKFGLAAPRLGHAGTKNQQATITGEAPSIQGPLARPQGESMGVALAGSVTPAPPVQKAPGSQFQPPRLIRSLPPVYPALARSMRVSGDVVLDAQIDVTGSVTSIRVVSGPVLLQAAAVETMRNWKYEPARLDGKPFATVLSVTVKFHE
jgi:protein TonB